MRDDNKMNMRKTMTLIVFSSLLATIAHSKGAEIAGSAANNSTNTSEKTEIASVEIKTAAAAEAKKETALSPTEEWIQKSKHPVSWLKWGADLRLREEYYSNTKQNSSNPDRETNQQRARMRLWTEIIPWEAFTFRVRGVTEPRTYIKPDSKQGYMGELLLDNLSVSLSPENSTLQALIGRQELSDLKVPWLLQDGTTIDGSRTTFFDAARLTYTSADEKTSVHGIFLYQDERSDAWLPPVGMQPSLKYLSEEDIVSGMLLIRNKSLENTTLEGLVIYKHEFESDQSLGTTGDTVTIRPKVACKINDHWDFEAEAAGQFGRRGDHLGNNMRDVVASGALSQLQYHFRDELKNTAWVGVEYLSGRGKDSETDHGFDNLWGRYSRIGELMSYSTRLDSGRAYDHSNMLSPIVGYSLDPVRDMRVSVDYRPMFAPENPYGGDKNHSEDGSFKGHLVRGRADYTVSKHTKAGMLFEALEPGDYYSERLMTRCITSVLSSP